ncbi:hypothetical protein LCGC14_2577670 [marine sediment metagenome]|uniref:Uncharacterized protein n=1 Tax=marine sediment metagenome TaxID=412755 RepID=A0A0F9B3B0_9ZZZZ
MVKEWKRSNEYGDNMSTHTMIEDDNGLIRKDSTHTMADDYNGLISK